MPHYGNVPDTSKLPSGFNPYAGRNLLNRFKKNGSPRDEPFPPANNRQSLELISRLHKIRTQRRKAPRLLLHETLEIA